MRRSGGSGNRTPPSPTPTTRRRSASTPRLKTAASAPTRRMKLAPTSPMSSSTERWRCVMSSLRQELGWAFGSHVVETGGELHRLGTDLSFTIRGNRNPTAVNGSSQQGGAGLPDSLLSAPGTWPQGSMAPRPLAGVPRAIAPKRAPGSIGAAPTATRNCRRASTTTWSLAPRTRLRPGARPVHAEPRLREARAKRLRPRPDGRHASGLRSEQAVLASAGLERDIARTAHACGVEGYYKKFVATARGTAETDEEQRPRLARYDFPRRSCRACRRIQSSRDADQRREGASLRL